MTIPLPYQLPTVQGWTLYDWRRLTGSTPPAAGGTAQLELPPVDPAELWLVDRIVSYSTAAGATALRLYIDAVRPGQLVDGSATGDFDVTEYPQGLLVRPGDQLIGVWTGVEDGAVGTLTAQLRVFRKAG